MSQVTVCASKTFGAPFVADKNGNFPMILTGINGEKITAGGLMNGSVANQLKIKDKGVYVIQITSVKSDVLDDNGKPYTNYRYNVIMDLTNSLATAVASKIADTMFDGTASTSHVPAEVEVEAPFGGE